MSCLKLHWPQSLSVYAPVDSEPVDSEPVDSEPVDSEPVDSEPADAEWSNHSDAGDEADGSEPVILSFPRRGRSIMGQIGPHIQRDLLTRARIIHENRLCEECGRAAVVPVDAEPALAYRDSMPVPGSSTLIGFACECCGHEWQA